MKIKILIAFLLLSTTFVVAQTEKGGFTIGGSGSLSRLKYKNSDVKEVSMSLSPEAGYFVVDHFCVGLSLPFSHTKTNYVGSDIDVTTTTFGAGPYVRYYIPLSTKLFVLTEGEFIFTRSNQQSIQFNEFSGMLEPSKSHTNQTQYRVGAGLAIFLNQHVSLDVLANYAHRTSNRKVTDDFGFESKTKTTYVYLSVGFKIFLPAKASG